MNMQDSNLISDAIGAIVMCLLAVALGVLAGVVWAVVS